MPPRKETVTRRKNEARKRADKKASGEVEVPKGWDPEARMAQLLRGDITVEDLDWEELLRGRLRDRDGKFRGRRAELLPRKLHDAISREIMARSQLMFNENYDKAMKGLIALIESPRTPARERLAAIQYVIERTVGKIPEKSEHKIQVTKFEQLVESGELVIDLDDDGRPALPAGDEDIQDAEVVEDL